MLHKKGQLVFANNQYYRMLGYEPDELIGINLIEKTLTPESATGVREHIAKGNLEPYEAVALAKDGRKFPVEVRPCNVEYKGKEVRVAVIRELADRI